MRATSIAAVTLLALCCLPALGRQAAGDVRRLSVPGQKWALEITLPGFVVQHDQMRGDRKARRIQAHTEDGYVVSVFYEPIDRPGKSAREFRDEGVAHIKAGDGSPFKIDDLKPSEYDGVPTLEYFIRQHRGMKVNQKHLNAYFVKDGMWVDVHFSKTLFEAGDEKLFHRALDTVRFVEAGDGGAAAPPPSSPSSPSPSATSSRPSPTGATSSPAGGCPTPRRTTHSNVS